MERSDGKLKKDLMTANEIAIYLLHTCGSLNEFESYLFGSSLGGLGNDIDILIVGPTGEKLSRLKQELAVAGRDLPLDILYMDHSEELETSFVEKERCKKLSELAQS